MTIDIFKPEDFWFQDRDLQQHIKVRLAAQANEKLEKIGLVMHQGGTSTGGIYCYQRIW